MPRRGHEAAPHVRPPHTPPSPEAWRQQLAGLRSDIPGTSSSIAWNEINPSLMASAVLSAASVGCFATIDRRWTIPLQSAPYWLWTPPSVGPTWPHNAAPLHPLHATALAPMICPWIYADDLTGASAMTQHTAVTAIYDQRRSASGTYACPLHSDPRKGPSVPPTKPPGAPPTSA